MIAARSISEQPWSRSYLFPRLVVIMTLLVVSGCESSNGSQGELDIGSVRARQSACDMIRTLRRALKSVDLPAFDGSSKYFMPLPPRSQLPLVTPVSNMGQPTVAFTYDSAEVSPFGGVEIRATMSIGIESG